MNYLTRFVWKKMFYTQKDYSGRRFISILENQFAIIFIERYNSSLRANGNIHYFSVRDTRCCFANSNHIISIFSENADAWLRKIFVSEEFHAFCLSIPAKSKPSSRHSWQYA